MVERNYAESAVEDAPPGDICQAHPEFVLVITRKRYIDLRLSEELEATNDYYRANIGGWVSK
jgi:hypothetical protein